MNCVYFDSSGKRMNVPVVNVSDEKCPLTLLLVDTLRYASNEDLGMLFREGLLQSEDAVHLTR